MTELGELSTPFLWADEAVLDDNLATMAEAWPRTSLRPHVKAHKTTAIAKRQAASGHTAFTCATPREVVGMAAAGLGADLLLANETVDDKNLRAMADADAAVTVAVDSEATIDAAARNGIEAVLIDIRVGFRCGCAVDEAGQLADRARTAGMEVRGVMGYEGHAVGEVDPVKRAELVNGAMTRLTAAHELVGGPIVSGGGTGSYVDNTTVTELQAGSYVLMDTAYQQQGHPFRQGLFVEASVISVAPKYVVLDAGLKCLAMDHGNPTIPGAQVVYCADEHTVVTTERHVTPGDRMTIVPAHIDPTMSKHRELVVGRDGSVVDVWDIDLRHW
ncbi:MAG: metal-activated pyridoxal enzyme [Actinobacteria bacterium]|nr:metal-activated pyridoxal enzyme [Actinomycetota bacterium]